MGFNLPRSGLVQHHHSPDPSPNVMSMQEIMRAGDDERWADGASATRTRHSMRPRLRGSRACQTGKMLAV